MEFIKEFLSQPAFLLGLMAFVGLVALKSPTHKILTGSLKPVLGYLMLAGGAGIIVSQLSPFAAIVEAGFHIKGVVPNNEAIVSIAQKVLGVETMTILLLGFVFNLAIAKFTKYKYIFLTGHHSLFMACLLSAVLQASGFKGTELIVLGGFIQGAWSAISPALGHRYTKIVTEDDGIAMGHFGSIQYYLSGFLADKFGDKSNNFEKTEISEKWGFLRDTTVTTGISMVILFLIVSAVAGTEFMKTISDQNWIIYSVLAGLNFAVGVAVVYAGVKLILADLVPAFKGISEKIIKDAVPAVDCAVFFTYSPTAVIVGFVICFITGLLGMWALGALNMPMIIPGVVAAFFCGGTGAVYADRLGGKRGVVIASIVSGLLLVFLPALLLPALGSIGFENTTFADFDFAILGLVLSNLFTQFGSTGIYSLVIILAIALIVPSFMKNIRVVGDTKTYEELTQN